MAVASYLKFHPNLSKHGGGANSEMQSGLASAASAKQEESQRQRQRLVESILIYALFVTSKIEFSNSPIVQFSNLKCCIKAKEPFKTPF